MTEAAIAIPSMDEYLEATGGRTRTRIKPELPDIDMATVPEAFGWRIFVMPPKAPEATEGGILLADKSQEAISAMRTIGIVVAIGPLAYSKERGYNDYKPVEVGDWVYFNENAGGTGYMSDKQGRMVMLKILNEVDLNGKPRNPSDLMVVL